MSKLSIACLKMPTNRAHFYVKIRLWQYNIWRDWSLWEGPIGHYNLDYYLEQVRVRVCNGVTSFSTVKVKRTRETLEKSSQVIVTYDSVPTCSHNVWVYFGFITPLPPNSPANVVTPNGNGLISTHFAYNSTLFAVGAGRSLVLLLSLGGSQH